MALPVTSDSLRSKAPASGVDPNVKIPRAVVEAGQRSDLIQRAITGQPESPPANGAAPNGAAGPSGGPETPVQGQPGGPGTPPAPDAPAPVGTPAAPPAAPPEAPPAQTDWERQFHSLQGRYDQLLKTSRENTGTLSQQVERLMGEVTALRGAQPLPPQPVDDPLRVLTEQEIADYGPELVDVMNRVAAAAAAPLRDEISGLRAQMGHVAQETTNAFMQRMNSTMDALVPPAYGGGWQALNKDPKFIEWSQLPDIFSGAIRRALMQEAWNSGNAQRLAAFFQAFLAEEAATNPQGSGVHQRQVPRTVVTPTPVGHAAVASASPLHPASPPLSLEDLAAPGRAHSPGGAPAEKPVYTAAEITRFYTDVAAGRWRGRDAERISIDTDIMMAQREGRIIPDNRTQLPRDPYQR